MAPDQAQRDQFEIDKKLLDFDLSLHHQICRVLVDKQKAKLVEFRVLGLEEDNDKKVIKIAQFFQKLKKEFSSLYFSPLHHSLDSFGHNHRFPLHNGPKVFYSVTDTLADRESRLPSNLCFCNTDIWTTPLRVICHGCQVYNF